MQIVNSWKLSRFFFSWCALQLEYIKHYDICKTNETFLNRFYLLLGLLIYDSLACHLHWNFNERRASCEMTAELAQEQKLFLFRIKTIILFCLAIESFNMTNFMFLAIKQIILIENLCRFSQIDLKFNKL